MYYGLHLELVELLESGLHLKLAEQLKLLELPLLLLHMHNGLHLVLLDLFKKQELLDLFTMNLQCHQKIPVEIHLFDDKNCMRGLFQIHVFVEVEFAFDVGCPDIGYY